MPMLDPVATFLQRILDADEDVDPVTALFGKDAEVTDKRRVMAEQLAQRAYDGGYIEDSGPAATDGDLPRVSLTPHGRQHLADLDL